MEAKIVYRVVREIFKILETQKFVTLVGTLGTKLSPIMRKLTFRICETKGADQLCSNCTADQHLCFRYTDSTISLLLRSENSSF